MLQHKGTQTIETSRLILRRFTMEDAPAMYRNWASDPEVTKYLTWPAHKNPNTTEFVIRDWLNQYDDPSFYQWAITLKGSPEPIGSIGGVHWNDRVGKMEVGYCLGKKWWHQGIMTEALRAVIWYFFEIVGFQRVEAMHDVNNPHSGQVMAKCGMQYEGTLRRSALNNQGLCDLACHAILKP